jgi:endonuclease/exonuclease/phosphatase family metal-dependent hydrolase
MKGPWGTAASVFITVLVGCGGEPVDLGTARSELSVIGGSRNAGGNKLLTVMSRNLYLGADLNPVVAALAAGQNPVPATSATWAMVQATNFPARAVAIADEIAATRPAVIGLQEVFRWRIGVPDSLLGVTTPNAETVVYDFLDTLLEELALRDLEYTVASQVQLIDVELPAVDPQRGDPAFNFLVDVRATDRDVILTRADVPTANPRGVHFRRENLAGVPNTELVILRGWTSVEMKIRGVWLRVVNSHPEPDETADGFFTALQTAELVDVLASEQLPLVLVGDLNVPGSQPGVAGSALYENLIARGDFTDTWVDIHPNRPGLTCCQAESLMNQESLLHERIDYVLFRGAISAKSATVVGDDIVDARSGLWPSDHAGVVGVLRLVNPKFAE